MTKESKIIIAGIIIFLFLLTIAFMSFIFSKGGFAWGLLWPAFIVTMISIGISIIISVIVYLLYNWIEK